MNSIKRAYFSLKANMGRTVLQIIIFSVVFAFIVACLIIYQTADDYVKTLELSVKNSVTIRPAEHWVGDSGAITGGMYPFEREDIEKLIEPEYVYGYNYSNSRHIDYRDKYNIFENTIETNPYMVTYEGDAEAYMLVDSKTDIAFTAFGFTLIDGRHITEADAGERVCLISKEFSEMNGLKIGDTLVGYDRLLKLAHDEDVKYELEIIGIFDSKGGEFLIGYGGSPDEIFMMPIDTFATIIQGDDEEEPSFIGTYSLSVYFENEEDIAQYIKHVENIFNVRKVFETRYDLSPPPLPEEAQGLGLEETLEYFTDNRFIDVYLDTEWYEMVAEPIERVRDLSGFALIGFVGGAVLILILISANSIKKRYREFGVLLSMGENKVKIAMQVCVETLTVIIIASFIGIILGILVGVPTVSHYTNSAYESQSVLNNQISEIANSDYSQGTGLINRDTYTITSALLFREPTDLSVAPNILPTYNLQVLLTFISFAGVLTIISALIQTIYITRIKPTVLLTSRR